MRALLLVIPLALLAGCAAPQEAGGCPPRAYASLHYEERFDVDLGRALEDLGWTRAGEEGGRATYAPPSDADVEAVVAAQPGTSAEGSVLSVEGTSRPEVREHAQALARHVNATLGDPALARWVEGTHTACPM